MALSPVNPAPASEREGLTTFLDRQRDILVRKIEGLTDAEARLAPTVSALSLLGIVKHCALWERRWFQVIFVGRTFPGEWPEVMTPIREDFIVGEDDTVQHWLTYYREQVEASREIVAGADLDALCAFEHDRDRNLRWVLLHHIEEVARHAGHADIIRETIDGAVGQ
jgi:hypothetical protein